MEQGLGAVQPARIHPGAGHRRILELVPHLQHRGAFSFLSDAGGWQLWFFTALAVGISGLLAFWLSRTARGDWRSAVPYALVIGGAIGNVIDRLMHGHVVDFIQWYVGEHTWPSFNIADSAIVGGAIGIALFGLFDGKRSRKAG